MPTSIDRAQRARESGKESELTSSPDITSLLAELEAISPHSEEKTDDGVDPDPAPPLDDELSLTIVAVELEQVMLEEDIFGAAREDAESTGQEEVDASLTEPPLTPVARQPLTRPGSHRAASFDLEREAFLLKIAFTEK